MRVRGARLTQPIMAKHGSLFLLTEENGDTRPSSDQGLYFHDMRYLSAETLRVDGQVMVPLLADASDGHRAVFELTNPDLEDDSGEVRVRKEALGIRREKCLGDEYTEVVTIQNYAPEPAEFTLQLAFQADFADMFVVRGMHPGKRGKLHTPRWRGSTLTFRYDQEKWQLKLTCELRDARTGRLESRPDQTGGARHDDREHAHRGSLAGGTQVETSNPLSTRSSRVPFSTCICCPCASKIRSSSPRAYRGMSRFSAAIVC